MLQHLRWLLHEKEYDRTSLIAIHSSFDKLLTSLRTAIATEMKLDKYATSYDDLLDALMMACSFYCRKK
jgi:hypothetical protein